MHNFVIIVSTLLPRTQAIRSSRVTPARDAIGGPEPVKSDHSQDGN
jgi:hypothetical protein